jgi:ABC-2 type transport system ATP-binding protein
MDLVLSCRDLVKSYDGVPAVSGVGFDIAPGECYGLLGPNGAGKTTTIAMIAGLVNRDRGEVTVAGQRLDTRSVAARAAIGLVPQDLALYPELSAADNLRFFGRLYGLTGEALSERVTATLETVGLGDRAGERVDRYSGGMKRRVNIAAGLIHRPALLILDEPTVGVDPQSRNAILATIESLTDEGMAVLYTTHYMEEAERLCDRVGVIDHGKAIALGAPRDLIASLGGQEVIELALDRRAQGPRSAAGEAAGEDFAALPGVRGVRRVGGGFALAVEPLHVALPAVLDHVRAAGRALERLSTRHATLEDVFVSLTGRGLRD